jgi:hypothetical protein
MKISILNIKNSASFILLVVWSFHAHARLVGKVHEIQGLSFMTYDGRTITLKKDMDIHESAQLIVSENGQLTVGDFHDRRYHLKGGSSLVFNKHQLLLHHGMVWIQSQHKHSTSLEVKTSNMTSHNLRGEMIVSYDNQHKKSQMMVIQGESQVASPKYEQLRYAIVAGQFTTVHPDQDDGYPRVPMSIGQDSLMKALGQFSGIKAQDYAVASAQQMSVTPSRSIASENKRGEIIYLRTVTSNHQQKPQGERKPASLAPQSAQGEASRYYHHQTQSRPKAPVRIWGLEQSGGETKIRKQAKTSKPKAVPDSPPMAPKREIASELKLKPTQTSKNSTAEFLKSWEDQKAHQHKHSPEVQRLIDDLKSF